MPHSDAKFTCQMSLNILHADRENTCVSKRQTLLPDPYVYTPALGKILKKVVLKFELSNV